MERVGFDLPKLPTPAHEPAWYGASLTGSTQAVMDTEYLKALTGYYERAEGWIDTETMKRQTSGDPKNYVPTPFTEAVPRRQVVAYDAMGTMSATTYAPVDARIPRPELPPFVDQGTGGGFKMAPPPDMVQAQMTGEVLRQISILQAKVDRLLTAGGK